MTGNWFRSVFSEQDGSGSWSRVGSGLVVAFTLGWVTYVVARTHVIPSLSGPLGFLSGCSSALYGVNKVTSCFDKDDNDRDGHDRDNHEAHP